MVQPKTTKKLKKELKLLDVYAISTGTTLSAGFFLLPGLAAVQAGFGSCVYPCRGSSCSGNV